ncbi:TetR family transcriptional regulator [Paenibacillus glycinis]|uniref:TetR family transcriptional regulator n=1 Tax=Paenibacillus glycinis TaxID=2697035 RepID=A0ABW9XY96_9BACL|nr:TetR family transcriptional regulator [Paenibacillus glycinis]NBD27698.1 TetR family transcriptional regulator [Paenibacillus glycinis]
MRRAMTDSAKAEKARLILDTAREIYRERDFNAIKMSDIAKAANVSNGSLFFYYKTKEILFMEILFQEYAKRFRNFADLLLPYGTMTHDEFKTFFLGEMASILDRDSLLIRLSAIKNTILEKNIDLETAVKDSTGLYAILENIVRLLTERVTDLNAEAFYELLLAQNAIIVGYANMASMPDVLLQAIDEHQLQGFQIDFKQNALTAMEYYLAGFYERRRLADERKRV